MTQQPLYKSTSSSCGGVGFFTEFRDLLHANRVMMRRLASDVSDTIDYCRQAEVLLQASMKRPIQGCRALEIGPGQWFSQILYFAQKCAVEAIDLDVLPLGFDPSGYWRMYRDNGMRRVVKTLGRKLLGVDRKYFEEYRRQLGVQRLPSMSVTRMDATKTTFAPATFDFVYSFNVFEHIPDPAAVLRECVRIVKPGGCIFTDLHLYTSDTGCHDPRIVSGDRQGLPFWPHLRPQHAHLWRAGTYLNKLRLSQWREIFESVLPGTSLTYRRDDNLAEQAAGLKRGGELAEYTEEELLTHWIIAIWRKPA